METVKTKKGTKITFYKKDSDWETIYFDGIFVSNTHFLIKKDERITFKFSCKEVTERYNSDKPFHVKKGIFNNTPMITDLSYYMPNTGYKDVCNVKQVESENPKYRVYRIEKTGELVRLDEKYAKIIDIISDEVKIDWFESDSNQLMLYSNGECVGTIALTYWDLEPYSVYKPRKSRLSEEGYEEYLQKSKKGG